MVVRVAQRVLCGSVSPMRVVVAGDHPSIIQACIDHGIDAVLTRDNHASGSDRLAEAAQILDLADDEVVVNVQGDEPLIDPALIDAVANLLLLHPQAAIGTAAHAMDNLVDFMNPNVVKVVLDAKGLALYFSRAPIAWWRDGFASHTRAMSDPAPLRHIGIYSYRVGFLRGFPKLAQAPIEVTESLEQLRALWHGYKIAVHVSPDAPGMGVDTPEDLIRVRALLSSPTPSFVR